MSEKTLNSAPHTAVSWIRVRVITSILSGLTDALPIPNRNVLEWDPPDTLNIQQFRWLWFPSADLPLPHAEPD